MTVPEPEDTLLWLADTDVLDDGDLAFYAGRLGPSERDRCERFSRPLRRRQFIAGRALLRLMLARLLRIEPADVALRERPGHAPVLVAGNAAAVGFGISHSGSWVACAGEARLRAFYRHWCLYEAGIEPGQASAADHVYMQPGLALALRCARPLAVAPPLEIVRLGAE